MRAYSVKLDDNHIFSFYFFKYSSVIISNVNALVSYILFLLKNASWGSRGSGFPKIGQAFQKGSDNPRW